MAKPKKAKRVAPKKKPRAKKPKTKVTKVTSKQPAAKKPAPKKPAPKKPAPKKPAPKKPAAGKKPAAKKPAAKKKPKTPKGGAAKGIDYGVLRATVSGGKRDKNPDKPHYTINLKANGKSFSAVVNVQSGDGSEVLFYADADVFAQVPALAKLWKAKVKKLEGLPEGWTALKDHKPGIALDYVREAYVDRAEMTYLPWDGEGDDDDIQDLVEYHVKRAKEEGAAAFVFGEQFPSGVHDVHMNQGNSGQWKKDNGIYQDGGVVLLFPSGRHVALLFAFQTQSWKTDESGNPK